MRILRPTDIPQLRQLIGHEVVHQGIPCRLVEVLDDPPAIVLRAIDNNRSLQETQHGLPKRKVPEHFTIPLFLEEGLPHPDYLALGLVADD